MHPVLFHIGNFPVGTYGVMIVIGILTGVWLAGRLAQSRGIKPEFMQDLAMTALLSGFLGARILYVIIESHHGVQMSLSEMIFSRGGFVFQGGAIAAIVVCAWYIKHHRQPVFETADIAAPALVLAHAFGRIGCFFSGCCYGLTCGIENAHPVLGKLAVQYPLVKDAAGRPLEMFNFAYFEQLQNHLIPPTAVAPLPILPVQLFESAGNVLICLVLLWLWKRRRFSGQVAALYLMLYAVLRFGLEFLRGDIERGLWFGGAISTAQIICLGMFAAGLALWWFRMNKGIEPVPAPAPAKAEAAHESAPVPKKNRRR
ncbi:prolipoprotein diacylglyceryl transferase [bacterium]|nr:prolipoprotein diacylglyceryl transferase [bacterium]